ncbi:MAG: NUDIX domain-containing protein [Patescibacteria group bacterium]|jgi:8-oxo-dGTP pyrophosphatase MutT (NUDIX family)
MPATKISIDNAKINHLFYFVANVVIYREDDARCLILKRSENEKVHPGKYCVPGGKLDWSDLDINNPGRINGEVLDFEGTVEKLLEREVMEEAGIEIYGTPIFINSNAFIRPDETPVAMVKLAMKYKSGEVKLEEDGFTNFVWVNEDEVKNYDCIGGIQDEVIKTIKLFKE